MKIFNHFPQGTEYVCPICKTSEDKPITLIGVYGTKDDNKQEAVPVHIECIHLELHANPSPDKKCIFLTLTQVIDVMSLENKMVTSKSAKEIKAEKKQRTILKFMKKHGG